MKTKPNKAKPYFWFQGASVRQLVDQLTTAGVDTVRLEVHQQGKKMTLLVVPEVSTQDHDPTHINDSHACPPDC